MHYSFLMLMAKRAQFAAPSALRVLSLRAKVFFNAFDKLERSRARESLAGAYAARAREASSNKAKARLFAKSATQSLKLGNESFIANVRCSGFFTKAAIVFFDSACFRAQAGSLKASARMHVRSAEAHSLAADVLEFHDSSAAIASYSDSADEYRRAGETFATAGDKKNAIACYTKAAQIYSYECSDAPSAQTMARAAQNLSAGK